MAFFQNLKQIPAMKVYGVREIKINLEFLLLDDLITSLI